MFIRFYLQIVWNMYSWAYNLFYIIQQHNYKMIYWYLLSHYIGFMSLIFLHKKSSHVRRLLLSKIWNREEWKKFTDVSEQRTGSICIVEKEVWECKYDYLFLSVSWFALLRQHVPPKYRYTPTRLHGVTYRKTVFSVFDVRSSSLTSQVVLNDRAVP
jgi:hypothetical protein